jgi:uncharacterized repeat protein (TIGR01451 family)
MIAISFKNLAKLKKSNNRRLYRWYAILPFLCTLPFSIGLLPVASIESASAAMMFETNVDSSFPKPGDVVTFTIAYSNVMDEPAYNVTVFEWMPSGLILMSSNPFYDGVSDPDNGFFRWSRGDVLSGQAGTIIVKAVVENVPVGSELAHTAHLTYELESGAQDEMVSGVKITVTQAAGVDVYHDQIHSVAPYTGEWTEYNITIENTGNDLDTFNIALRSVAYNPSSASHSWKIELFNSTGYPQMGPVATVYDENQENRTSWTEHGVVAEVTLTSGELTWIILRVTEAAGTSGSGDAYIDVNLIATSVFDPTISDQADELTIVKSVAGITLAPDYSRYANPGETLVYRHIIINSGQTEVIDLNCTSLMGWDYTFSFDNGTVLEDTDGSGSVDVGELPKNGLVYILINVTVPYSTPAAIQDVAEITALGVTSGNHDSVNDTTTVKSTPLLRVQKTLISENPGYEGDLVTYQMHIENLGNTKLTQIPLDDAFETTSLDFSTADPAEDAHDEAAGTIHWENVTTLEPGQSVVVTVTFVATAGDTVVRQSANVIDAEDEFGNLISATYNNKELKLIGSYTLNVTALPTEAIGGGISLAWIEHGTSRDGTFTTETQVLCDQETMATISCPASPVTQGEVRYVFTHCTPSATVLMDSDKTVTLNYQTEYNLTFGQTGSSEPVYITIDGTELSEALPQSVWIPGGSSVTFSYASPLTDTAGTTRYVLMAVSGNTTATTIAITAPSLVTGLYKTQYYLDVVTDPLGLDDPQHSGWYDEGAYANLAVTTPTGGDGTTTRYRFDHWTGTGIDDEDSPGTQILMDSPKVAKAHFVRQHKLTVISDHGSPNPIVGDHWYDEGDVINASVQSPAEESDGTRYGCTGWSGTGSVPTIGSSSQIAFDLTAPSSIEWNWKTQHYLTVLTDPKDLDNPSGDGWYDEGTHATISVASPTGGDTVSTRYRFQSWTGTDIADETAASTAILINAPKTATAVLIQQFYLTTSTNFGVVTPESGWYDVGSVLPIEAIAPTMTEGEGYVWHGWTGIGESSYDGSDNPAAVTMNSAISETAYWKLAPVLTVSISNETIASGDKITIHGSIVPGQAGVPILVVYMAPNGTEIEHNVYTKAGGSFDDILFLDQGYPYSLFVDGGEWLVTARRLSDTDHENAQTSTSLIVEPRAVGQFHPILMAGAIVAFGLIAYIPPSRKVKNGKTWWRITLVLSIAGLVLGAVALALNWVLVSGTLISNAPYQVDISIHPFQGGLVSITQGLHYVGADVPSLVHSAWQHIVGSRGPVLTLYLAATGYAMALVGLYKPKTTRQKRLKAATLLIAGILIATSAIHAVVFVQGQIATITGAGVGCGLGVYATIISSILVIFAGLCTTREKHAPSLQSRINRRVV